MATQKLTARTIETATATKETLISDGGGLYLRVRPATDGGRCLRHWLFIYSSQSGKRRKLMLGDYPTHSLAQARTWASEQGRQLDNGIDPAEAKRTAKRDNVEKSIKTCGALLDAYAAHLKAQGKQSSSDVENIFKLHVSDSVKQLPACNVTHKDLIYSIRKLVEAGKGRTSAKLRSYLRAAFELALNADENPSAPSSLMGFKLRANPAAGIKVPAGTNIAGERTLSRKELDEYIKRVKALPDGDVKDLLLLQVLLAGQRVSQLLRATIDKDTIVQRDGKGKRETPRRHVLPLQGDALSLVKSRGKLFELTDNTINKRAVERASTIVGNISDAMVTADISSEKFRLGDIRRTAETMLAQMGFNSDVRGQLLSHGLGGIQNRNYDKHNYMSDKLLMLQAWERSLSNQPSDNVVPINKAA